MVQMCRLAVKRNPQPFLPNLRCVRSIALKSVRVVSLFLVWRTRIVVARIQVGMRLPRMNGSTQTSAGIP